MRRFFLMAATFFFLLSCSKQEKISPADSKMQPEVTSETANAGDTHDNYAEFPIPELDNENVKLVNDVLMENLRQGLIDDSRNETTEGQTEADLIPLGDVEKPDLEIDVIVPEFNIVTKKEANSQEKEKGVK